MPYEDFANSLDQFFRRRKRKMRQRREQRLERRGKIM
jgi:hypothetical protein